MRKMQSSSRGLFKSPKTRHLVLILGIAAVIVLLVFWYFSRPASKKTGTIPSSTSVGTSVNNQPSSTGQTANSGNTPASSSSSAGSVPPTATLITPWGNFISNHHPGQNGAPTAESSACNTSAGATCYIKFTNGGQTRVLDSKVANGNGAVIWNWDVKSAGFSAGSWQVSAIASLGGQTRTAVDATPLVVQ